MVKVLSSKSHARLPVRKKLLLMEKLRSMANLRSLSKVLTIPNMDELKLVLLSYTWHQMVLNVAFLQISMAV